MKYPDNQNPNQFAILSIGCVGAFLLPFAIRFGHVPTITVTTTFAIYYLVSAYWVIARNHRANQNWIRENGIDETTCREAKKKLETFDPNEMKIILKHQSWPLNFSHLKPRAVLVHHTGNRYWIRWRFTPRIYQLLTIALRRGVRIEDVSGMRWQPKPSKIAG